MSLLESAMKLHELSTRGFKYSGTKVELHKLVEGSEEYQSVISKVDLLFRSTCGPQQVVRVQNPCLWGCYQLKKAECVQRSSHPVNEQVLFHATAQSNIDSIAENNFDWRRSVRTKYGSGVSFSPSARYANTWCNRNVGSERALVVAKVLVGKSHTGTYLTELPSQGCDTTVGNKYQVYVKYCDHEFYPEYVIYYSLHDLY